MVERAGGGEDLEGWILPWKVKGWIFSLPSEEMADAFEKVGGGDGGDLHAGEADLLMTWRGVC